MPEISEVVRFKDGARLAPSPLSGGTRAQGTAREGAARGALGSANSCDVTCTDTSPGASPCPHSSLSRRPWMFQTLVEVEPRRLQWIERQLSQSHLLSVLNIEVDEKTGIASVLWAERTRDNMRKVAVVGFLIELARLDVPLFCLYQTEQERPS